MTDQWKVQAAHAETKARGRKKALSASNQKGEGRARRIKKGFLNSKKRRDHCTKKSISMGWQVFLCRTRTAEVRLQSFSISKRYRRSWRLSAMNSGSAEKRDIALLWHRKNEKK